MKTIQLERVTSTDRQKFQQVFTIETANGSIVYGTVVSLLLEKDIKDIYVNMFCRAWGFSAAAATKWCKKYNPSLSVLNLTDHTEKVYRYNNGYQGEQLQLFKGEI